MDFEMNEDTSLLRTMAEKFLSDQCPLPVVKDIMKTGRGFSESLWKEIAELGWLGFALDEKYGGMGGSLFDLFVLFCEIGKALLPSPFFCSSVMSGFLIQEGGSEHQKRSLLPQIASGEKISTVGYLDKMGGFDLRTPGLKATKEGSGSYTINGTLILVPYAHIADTILVYTGLDRGEGVHEPTILAVDAQAIGLKRPPLQTLSGESCSALIFDNVRVPEDSAIGMPGTGDSSFERVLPKAMVLKCGEMVGGLERVLHMTVAYLKERVQFGRPLGTLQAIHHYCADMATYLETSRLIGQQAAFLLSEGISCNKEISMAKAWCSEAYKKTTWIAHQLHGGIGFTEEHDLHLFYKHAKECELEFRDSLYHRAVVADEMGL